MPLLIRFAIGFAAAMAFMWIVTAAVTPARSQLAGDYHPTVLNLDTGKKYVGSGGFPDQNRCDQAISGINDWLAYMADQDPGKVQPAEPDAMPEIKQATAALIVHIYQETNKVPRLTITCEIPGTPS